MAKRTIEPSEFDEQYPDNSLSKKTPLRELSPKSKEIIKQFEAVENNPPMTIERKVVRRQGVVRRKKGGFIKSFVGTFFSENSNNVARYVLEDVLLPAAKNTLSEMIQTFIDTL